MVGRSGRHLVLGLVVLIGLSLLIHLTIRTAPAQHGGKVTVTGKVVDRLLKHFEGSSGLTGVRTIELRRLTMAPGAMMEGDMVFDDHAELCLVEKGTVTFTMADGSKRTFKAGDIYITPLGAKQKRMVADPNLGYQELVWQLNVKRRH